MGALHAKVRLNKLRGVPTTSKARQDGRTSVLEAARRFPSLVAIQEHVISHALRLRAYHGPGINSCHGCWYALMILR